MERKRHLIDVNDAEKMIMDVYVRTAGFRSRERLLQVTENLKNFPTVDAVEVVHARWIHHFHDSGEPIDDKWYCSECHMCNEHSRTWYCPSCGAKMDN